MKELEFNLLRDIKEKGLKEYLNSWTEIEEYKLAVRALERDGYVFNGTISEKGERELEKHKVDNAVIMAAGYSARCMPLSSVLPKGLFRIKGEILIERQIKQLRSAGIDEIIIVTGHLNEKFNYLQNKYGARLVYNADYDKYNNMSSLYAAQDYLKNTYVLCSDNYYEENVFHKYVLYPYYSCVYSDKFCDEYCVTEVAANGDINSIHRGGEHAWYTIGDCYFDADYSDKFKALMNDEWSDFNVRGMLMDDFQIRHLDVLRFKKKERLENSILEFDTLEEIKEFDKDFIKFEKENLDVDNEVNHVLFKYSEVKSYHSVPTEQLGGRLHLNENLYGPSPKCIDVLKSITLEDLYLYDLTHRDELVDTIAAYTGISGNNIFVHNGSSEVIKSIFSILLNENDVILIPSPGWSYYKSVADAKFARCLTYEVREGDTGYEYNVEDVMSKADEYSPKMIVITSPQMPTGCEIPHDDIERIIRENQNSVVMLDEAYWGYEDFSNKFEKNMITQYSNVVITRTFSKFYGLANVRIGYGLCSYPLRRTIGLDLPLFRASGISRKIAIEAIKDTEYYDKMRAETKCVRDWFIDELNKLDGVKAYKTGSNFVFIKLLNVDPDRVRVFMEENGILIRLFTDKDALRLRITIGPKDIMERVLLQLRHAIRNS